MLARFLVWALFVRWWWLADRPGRVLLAACVVFAALGECFLSLVWGLYDYRLGSVPWFVPAESRTVVRASTGIMYEPPLGLFYQDALQENGAARLLTANVTPTQTGAPAIALPSGPTAISSCSTTWGSSGCSASPAAPWAACKSSSGPSVTRKWWPAPSPSPAAK